MDDLTSATESPAGPTAEPLGPAVAPVTRPIVRHTIETKERRYWFRDIAPLRRFLQDHGEPIQYVPGRTETHVTTVYVDTAGGTWSVGLSANKFRLKSYDDPSTYWFEVKRRRNLRVEKRRQPIGADEVPAVLMGRRRGPGLARLIGAAPLAPLVAVRYRRTAFEWPKVRLTVDRHLTFHAVDPGTPWSIGRRLGHMAGFVVEVKTGSKLPKWLKPALGRRTPQDFSKSRWSLMARGNA